MYLNLVGCNHRTASVALRERLAFSPAQVSDALTKLRAQFPGSEAVLLSTCNRVELYTASIDLEQLPTHEQIVRFLADYHGLETSEIVPQLVQHDTDATIRHLFSVAASLDSMVMGEAQILSQVKAAYELATDGNFTGPLTNSAFQAAIRVARRVSNETMIHQRRVSIPSVAVADFAKQVFERFDDKFVLLIGAGEMGQETARYLVDEGAQQIVVVNRNRERADELAREFAATSADWSELDELLVKADVIVSTTGATEPIVSAAKFRHVQTRRYQRPVFILDLAVPRDFESAVGELVGVYLFSVDDLQAACDANRRRREKEWPAAQRIIEEETTKFFADWNHRATAPTIRRLRDQANQIKSDELTRLLNRLEGLDPRMTREVEMAFDRLVNKLLHPPLESLRDEAEKGTPHGLLDALRRLFQLKE